MPTYDYRCDRCERTFEVRQRISEAALTTCDRCGGPIHRLLAAAPFILKGGWYVTDYPSEGRKKGMESEKSATSASPSTASSTSSTTTPSSNSSSSSSSSGDGAAPKPASTSPS